MDKHSITVETPYGTFTATWERAGRNIIVRYGEREKPAQASDNHATNEFVARDIVRGWIAEDMKDSDLA